MGVAAVRYAPAVPSLVATCTVVRRARRRVEGAGWVSPYTDYCNMYEHLALKFARNAECGPRPAHRQATALPIRHAKMQEKHAYSTL